MREIELLASIASSHAGKLDPRVLVGPGDDAAVVITPLGERIVLTVDQVIVGRHVTAATSMDLVARKAVARSISDLAAMTARPLCSLATAAMPPGFPQAQAIELSNEIARWGRHFGCPVVGGDVAELPLQEDSLTLTVTAIGTMPPGRFPPLRSGARIGDGIYVTGSLGGSFERASGLGRHLTFEPRLAEAAWLADQLAPGGESRLHAMIDISDGLGLDASRIAEASGCSLVLESQRIPRASDVASWQQAVRDGEDYELLFCASGEVPAVCGVTGTSVTRIGQVEKGTGVWVIDGARRVDVAREGWMHGDASAHRL